MDAFGLMRFAQVRPLDAELGALFQQRHKIRCERAASSLVACSYDL